MSNSLYFHLNVESMYMESLGTMYISKKALVVTMVSTEFIAGINHVPKS